MVKLELTGNDKGGINMEILFRGFHSCKDGKETIWINGKEIKGDWKYGYYVKAKYHWHKYGIHEDWIITSVFQNGGFMNVCGRFSVISETVGQYTGRLDMSENKIFSNDMVNVSKGNELEGKTIIKATVEWSNEESAFVLQSKESRERLGNIESWSMWVIGNKWRNPELLEV